MVAVVAIMIINLRTRTPCCGRRRTCIHYYFFCFHSAGGLPKLRIIIKGHLSFTKILLNSQSKPKRKTRMKKLQIYSRTLVKERSRKNEFMSNGCTVQAGGRISLFFRYYQMNTTKSQRSCIMQKTKLGDPNSLLTFGDRGK